ncbi:hypothetical protein NliqN6_3331 [Naganishia liquefaciens]|uniref:Acyl-CoA desaturase n=1 Tax=Naganishia liquefaciens TaxID=104408 RepID=A0A8H3TVI0_9TREE|nr:hypothetical protein NliqN6_3331 [Naganishia liquefaciens]
MEVEKTLPSTPQGSIPSLKEKPQIWWSNGIFFIGAHIMAIYGMIFLAPPTSLSWKTWLLCFVSWQLASFGVTLGYHRLWSHRAYTATLPLRIVLAWMASMGFQGSAKWWVLRHRLHHRFTDSPEHDPYSATKGLWFAHCGWIFFKPKYSRMKLIEREDLESDPVVVFQHKHYISIALFSGLILPTLIAKFGWNDAIGGYIWGGLVARLLIWHTTFCINSLAHWSGLQPYTEEVSARGNYLLAVLTSGEGNHNFHHAFPKDFRNGPHPADWDPTKWIISALHKYTPFVPTIATTPESEILKARAHVHRLHADRLTSQIPHSELPKDEITLPQWTKADLAREIEIDEGAVFLLIDGYIVDVGGYLDVHPGGPSLLRNWSIKPDDSHSGNEPASSPSRRRSAHGATSPADSGYESASPKAAKSRILEDLTAIEASCLEKRLRQTDTTGMGMASELKIKDASKAFFGQINNHSQAAKEKMRCFRVAKLSP